MAFPFVSVEKGCHLTIQNWGRNPDISVWFEHNGKHYTGYFSEVIGAAGYLWDLTVNRHYRGGVMHWRAVYPPFAITIGPQPALYHTLKFHTHHGDLEYLEDHFVEFFIQWYQ